MSFTIELADTPPTANRQKGRTPKAQHRLKKALQADLERLLMACRLPRGNEAIRATAVLRFPVTRRRDTVNYWLLDKALGDALVNGGWLGDDTPEHFQLRMRFDPDTGPRRTRIDITPTTTKELWSD